MGSNCSGGGRGARGRGGARTRCEDWGAGDGWEDGRGLGCSRDGALAQGEQVGGEPLLQTCMAPKEEEEEEEEGGCWDASSTA